jgi:DNA helicase-2/ATP-dependent DNA helicase PcrA
MHLKAKFKVISQSQQLSIIKRLLEFNNSELEPKKVLTFINSKKDKGLRAIESTDVFEQVYWDYQVHCKTNLLMDFGDLLLRSYELLKDSPKLLAHYQAKFAYCLVDEAQDTNYIQFEFLKLLTQAKQNLFIVGDDDQSIYSFRGAVIENMTTFQSDYPNHELVKLEQNYRCSATILDAANKVHCV